MLLFSGLLVVVGMLGCQSVLYIAVESLYSFVVR